MAFGTSNTKKSVRPSGPETPRKGWGWFGNLLILVGLWGGGMALIHLGGPQRYVGLAEGQRAPATVVAAVDFECVDVPATELLRRQASEGVVPVFSIQTGPLQAVRRTLEKLANRASTLRHARMASGEDSESGPEPGAVERGVVEDLDVAADLLGVTLSGEELAQLFPSGKEQVSLALLTESLSEIWMNGILTEQERQSGFQGLSDDWTVDIRLPGNGDAGRFQRLKLRELPSVEMAIEEYVETVAPRLTDTDIPVDEAMLEALVRTSITPNLAYSERMTRERRLAAREEQEPVRMTVRAGTTLMEDRATVTAQTVEMINAYNRRVTEMESPLDQQMKLLGNAILLAAALLVCVGWLRGVCPDAIRERRYKWLLVLLALFSLLLAGGVRLAAFSLNWVPPWLVSFLIPMTLVTMLAVLMRGPAEALVVGLWSSLASALVFDTSFVVLLLGLGGSVTAVLLMRNVRKRSQVLRAGLAVGLVNALLALAMAAMVEQTLRTCLLQVAAGLASGVVTAILVTLLLPFFEWAFQHTTAISLLELTDMSHPLLQRLALEAPGTYHHSLMVAALGQAAANRIGANGLLVSVCATFHDIGKLPKPEFFTENQRSGDNPHDSLAPSMSALVIQSHVKEGQTLAKRYKLPRAIVEGIQTHHGTTLTSYFYQMARRELKDAGLSEDSGLEHSYRYDGPRPMSREMAVLMLADTVEAASRSLERPSPDRIAEMVETLMREKLLDGQLDLCPLTLRELHEVRASFVFSLSNILHGRNPYPREDSLVQPAAEATAGSGGGSPSDSSAGQPGVSR